MRSVFWRVDSGVCCEWIAVEIIIEVCLNFQGEKMKVLTGGTTIELRGIVDFGSDRKLFSIQGLLGKERSQDNLELSHLVYWVHGDTLVVLHFLCCCFAVLIVLNKLSRHV